MTIHVAAMGDGFSMPSTGAGWFICALAIVVVPALMFGLQAIGNKPRTNKRGGGAFWLLVWLAAFIGVIAVFSPGVALGVAVTFAVQFFFMGLASR